MSQVTAIVQRIVMNADFNVSFYDQYSNLLITLETATDAQVVGTYLICGDSDGNSIKFFVNEITSIEGPTFSQTYTPIPAGFYQQDQAYFNRLSEIYNYVNTNVVNVVIRWIDALKFADGTTQTTAATGGGGSGTVTSVGFTAGTGITVGGTNPITTSGTVTITNSAPDQVVTLTEGAGIDITGTYPSFTIASTVTGGIPHGSTSGTDTYTTTISGVTAYNDADAYLIRFNIGNTTSATLNINSLGAIPLYRNNDGELIGGDIIDGAEMLCVYNSSTNRFQVIGTAPNTLLAYVTNAESTPITKGQPVYAFGGQGDRLKVKLAYNTGDPTSAQTVGMVLSTSIGANQKGLIIVNGQLDGLGLFKPSDGWLDGDAVYLGPTAGTVTRVKPHAPNHLVYLGFCTTASSGAAGRMYVRVQNGYEMDELHDVSAQTPSNNDGLFFNTSTSLWESKSIATALGYTPQQQLTLTTTGNSGPATLSGGSLNIPEYTFTGVSVYVKNNTSYSSTGTGSQIIHSLTIPANTFEAGDVLRITARFKKVGVNSTSAASIYINNSVSLSGGKIVRSNPFAATTLSNSQQGTVVIINRTNLTQLPFTVSSATDIQLSTGAWIDSTAIDWTATQYLLFSCAPNNVADVVSLIYYQVEKL